MGRPAAAGAEGIVLGCTEIELLIGQADSPVEAFPTIRIHAEAAIAAATTWPIGSMSLSPERSHTPA
jgi:aspartate racemase